MELITHEINYFYFQKMTTYMSDAEQLEPRFLEIATSLKYEVKHVIELLKYSVESDPVCHKTVLYKKVSALASWLSRLGFKVHTCAGTRAGSH